MLGGREPDQRVVHRAAGDAQPAERLRQACKGVRVELKRRAEPLAQQPRRIGGRQPHVTREASEDRVGLRQRVTAQRQLPTMAPTDHIPVCAVGLHEQRHRHARVECQRGHRRPESINPKTSSSSITVSPVATSAPASSTRRAVRPVGTSASPAP